MTQHPASWRERGPTGSHTAAKFLDVPLPSPLEYSNPYSNVPLCSKRVGRLTHVAAASGEHLIQIFTSYQHVRLGW